MIVVTGASSGIGKAITNRLVSNGHKVFGISRNISELTVEGMGCDVSSYEQVKKVSDYLKSKKKYISAIINTAGIASMNLALFTPNKITHSLISTNLLGTIYCCQLLSPLMIRRKQGSIINFSTIAVSLGLKGESIYVASKAGVEGFSKSFAREMADFNVNVNCIAPGPIKTNLLKGITDNQIEKIVNQQIIKKVFLPDDVCNVVDILLDKKSNSITGQVLHVGGK